MVNFYTAQYHTKLTPNLMSDVNGEYRRHDQRIARMPQGGAYYSTFSLWDTFRAWNPLQTLVDTTLVNDMIRSMLDMYDITGELPIWPLASGETGTMIGYHAASVIADAYLKGIRGYDAEKALDAMIRSSNINKKGSDYYVAQGFIPSNIKRESVSCTLEYAYDDWCILQVARKLNRPQAELDKWAARARNYRNVFDPETRLMRGRLKDGKFQAPFSPYKWGDAFTEGNSWHYTWSVFHDVEGLVDLMGGREQFVQMLDSVFVVPPIYDDSYYGFRIHEITEMQVADMGNYAHGNQPAQHMIYLYNYAGAPWKAQYWAREVMDRLYSARPDGYCGDEDNGQTSAWYVFSALGFYPVCPASDEYVVGSPLFRKAVVNLENGNKIVLEAPDNSPENRYIGAVQFDGKAYTHNFLRHSDLVKGAGVRFSMRPEPDYARGTEPGDAPYSFSRE